MGNCMERGSSIMDDWASSHRRHGRRVMDESGGGREKSGGGGPGGGDQEEEALQEKQRLLGNGDNDDNYERGASASSSSSPSSSSNKSTREVKIKITRKELIGRANVQGLSVEQVLARLINGGGSEYHHDHGQHQRQWRPVLQSIPEGN